MLLIAVGLAGLAVAVFLPTVEHDFLEFDDSTYVTRNPMVAHGLTAPAVRSAWTTPYASNYHPLTTVSQAATTEFAGLDPRAFHAVNVALHAVNAALLFVLLRVATGATWRSAVVAALFAVHPANVQPVAWVTSRKDLLAFFFAVSALLAWTRHVRRPGPVPWSASLLLFAGSLLSKLSCLPLPAVLLAWDFWPYRRTPGTPPGADADDATGTDAGAECVSTWRRLVLEKLPWLVPAAAVFVVVARSQMHDSAPVAGTETGPRAALVRVATNYVAYLRITFWPVDLSASYRPSEEHSAWDVAACLALLAAITAAAWRARRACPAALVGWSWFVAMFVPTVGFVPLFETLRADRYLYVPLVGLFVAVAWGLERAGRRFGGAGVAGQAVLWSAVVAAGAVASSGEVVHWKNDLTLFSRAVAVDDRSPTAFLNLGTALVHAGRREEAAEAYRRSVALSPHSVPGWIGLGNVAAMEGRWDDALAAFEHARSAAPQDVRALLSCSLAQRELGREAEADDLLERALAADPTSKDANLAAGTIELRSRQRFDRAVVHLRRALQLDPRDAAARSRLVEALLAAGRQHLESGRFDEAAARLEEAVRLDPTSAAARELARELDARRGADRSAN